jgi:hypothetical protein
MFCIQLKIAVESVISPPEIDSTSIKNIRDADVELPIITVCPISQTNKTALKLLGYDPWDKFDFHGASNNSWGSIYNLTFEELKSKVYQTDIAENVLLRNIGSNSSNVDLFYLPHYGFCREISHYNAENDIYTWTDTNQSQEGIQLFITDRNFKSHFSLDFSSQKGSPMIIPDNKRYAYVVDVEIDSTCSVNKRSAKEKNNFKQCIDDQIHTDFGNPMGCLPPWMSWRNQCSDKYPNSYKKTIVDLLNKYISSTVSLINVEIEMTCRKYCSRGRYSVKLISTDAGDVGPTAHIVFNQEVKVHEKVFNYSFFHFIIDVGSSLGLWLGLSALGIYDIIVQAKENVREMKICKKVCYC